MDERDLALAVIPPATAILIELFSPFRESYFAAQTDAIFAADVGEPSPEHKAAVDQALETAKTLHRSSLAGAASISGLMPTLVSFIVSGAALLVSAGSGWWLMAMILALVVMAIAVVRIVMTRTLLQLETVPVRFPGGSVKPTSLFSHLVYTTNFVLLALAAATYAGYVT